ncbi:MAG: 3-keto-disaccharide hydrolase [Limisphaerales bacterium]
MRLIGCMTNSLRCFFVGLAIICVPGLFGQDNSVPAIEPPKVDPGPVGGAPSDAIVLFGGKDLTKWVNDTGGPADWAVKDGVVTISGTNQMFTKQAFGDCQLHVEWASPNPPKGKGQARGNSGIYLQSRYEVQVLDSIDNPTYFNGQAGSIYKQYAPLVNACRKPGEWQTYDIIFHAPRFAKDGKLITPARVTLLHNGVLALDNVELKGFTHNDKVPSVYVQHNLKEPLRLQNHHSAVRFRNIWIREL